jgi:DNA-binding LytR/AlgR family response regulator
MKIIIGICDDEKYFRDGSKNIVESSLKEIEQDYEIRLFETGKELIESLEKLDILLLDIEMPKISGFGLAEIFIEKRKDTRIIFVSNYEEMVFESIKYQPYRFIRKEEVQYELPEAIRSCVKLVIDEGEAVSFHNKDGEFLLRSKDIIYLEVYDHDLHVIHKNGEEICRGSLVEAEKKILDKNIIRIHKSYLVNMEYAYCILKGKLQLENGKELPISRKYDKDVKNRFKFLAGFKID